MATYRKLASSLYAEGVEGSLLVIGVKGAANNPVNFGILLDVSTQSGHDNQLWEQVLDASSGYYFLQSKLRDEQSQHLVIDIQGGNNPVKPGALLDAYYKKKTGYDNQLWKFEEQIPSAPGWYTIQSKMTDEHGKLLVIDIKGASDKRGALLVVDTPNGNSSQLWQLAG